MRGTLETKARHTKHRSLREIEQRIRSVRRSGSLTYKTVSLGAQVVLPGPLGFVRISSAWLEFGCLFKVIYRVPRTSVSKIFRNPMVLPTDHNIRFDLTGARLPKEIVFGVTNPEKLIKVLRLNGWNVSHR